jgi:alkylation response protein AidB-like acyl-CoA dehydrogenase
MISILIGIRPTIKNRIESFVQPSETLLKKRSWYFDINSKKPNCYAWDEEKRIPKELFLKAAKAGILQGICGHWQSKYAERDPVGGVNPEEYDAFHEFIICDELARCGSGGVLWGLIGGLGIGLPPVIHFGSDYIKDKVVKDCLNGRKNICLAITEPSAGSDVASIFICLLIIDLKTEAKKTPDGKFYIVNGEKKWITNGVFADYFTVAVRTGGISKSIT